MNPDQYMAAQMHMAALYTQAWAPAPAYGSFVRRLGALVIDCVIVLGAMFIGGFLVGLFGGVTAVDRLERLDSFGSGGTVLINLFMTLVMIGFNALGGTPGKRALGLRITNREGGLPGPALAAIRAWPWIVLTLCNAAMWMVVRQSGGEDVSPTMLQGLTVVAEAVWLIGCFFVLGTRYKQALHDKLAGTYVIRT